MYRAYKDDPQTASIAVLGPSFANSRDLPGRVAEVCSNPSMAMDAGNLHNYSGLNPENALAGGWGVSLPEIIQRYRSLSGAKPLWVTENGYKISGSVRGFPAVTQRAAAKYLPRQLLIHLTKSIRRYYIYQLIDNREAFGLLNTDGSPRLQYTSVKNFISIFKDPGAPFQTGALD